MFFFVEEIVSCLLNSAIWGEKLLLWPHIITTVCVRLLWQNTSSPVLSPNIDHASAVSLTNMATHQSSHVAPLYGHISGVQSVSHYYGHTSAAQSVFHYHCHTSGISSWCHSIMATYQQSSQSFTVLATHQQYTYSVPLSWSHIISPPLLLPHHQSRQAPHYFCHIISTVSPTLLLPHHQSNQSATISATSVPNCYCHIISPVSSPLVLQCDQSSLPVLWPHQQFSLPLLWPHIISLVSSPLWWPHHHSVSHCYGHTQSVQS
jgi:hypothetical protein